MGTLDSAYKWGKSEELTAENFDKRFLDINHRLGPLEALNLAYDVLVGEVNDTVLARVNETIDGLRVQLQQIALLQWLTGVSGSSITLTEGADSALLIVDTDRELFTPGPYSVLQRVSDANTYAILKSQSYDRASGQYNFNIQTVFGTPGTYTDWSVAAVAGSTLAQITLLATGRLVRDAAIAAAAAAAADRALADADASATALDRAAVHDDRIAADGSASAAATAASQAKDFAATVDNSTYVKKTGATPFTGVQQGVAPAPGDNSSALTTSAWVRALLAGLVNGSPAVLDTLKELADAIGDDPNFAITISSALANRVRVDTPQAVGAHAQRQAQQNIDALSPGQILALAIAN